MTGSTPSTGANSQPNIIVVFTDDQGYADLGVQGVAEDVRTPNIDRLAEHGVRFTDGYVTAPMCAPSRAGLLTGRYQQRYGLETNFDLPIDLTDLPLPGRLRRAGYRTGMLGKLHLPAWTGLPARLHLPKWVPREETPSAWGFDEFFMKAGNFDVNPNGRFSTHDLAGRPFPGGAQWFQSSDYHIDADTKAALQFIDRNHERPFFLYLAYFAPHVPLEAPSDYLARFADIEPPGRRYALAMISAVDDGVGEISEKLRDYGIDEQTLIFFISDNGAPLESFGKDIDVPVSDLKRWNGSLNTPYRGEKDMLLEGGIRVPFIAHWPSVLPAGTVYQSPVSTLDVSATALAVAGVADDDMLDGTNLIPHLMGERSAPPHQALFWALGGQEAIRKGKWKLLKTGYSGRFLFDLDQPAPERRNMAEKYPEIAAQLDTELEQWLNSLGRRDAVQEKRLKREERMLRNHLR